MSCSICLEDFVAEDEATSTNCGHVFHKHCLEQSMRREARCPDCREENPQTHRIYIPFPPPRSSNDDSISVESLVLFCGLKDQIETIMEVQKNLHERINEGKEDYQALEARFETTERQLSEQIENLKIQNESIHDTILDMKKEMLKTLNERFENFLTNLVISNLD